MVLLALLVLPVLIGIVGYFVGKGRITWKEVVAHELVVLVIIGGGYAIGRYVHMADTEIWSGTITRKWSETSGCCHSYDCFCHETCSGSGSNRSCHRSCQTCHYHNHDVEWNAITSNGETVFHDGCNAPGSAPPARWEQIVVGEPTAVEHSFVNYIKAAPGAFAWKKTTLEQYAKNIPAYPRVYDHYRARRFLAVGVSIPDADALNTRLAEINGNLGVLRKVNIIVVAVDTADPEYADALAAAWLGGKKNDLIVAIGVSPSPTIAWIRVISWTKSDAMKAEIQSRIMELGTLRGPEALSIIAEEVNNKFVRRPMADFAYLKASIEPPPWIMWTLFVLGILAALGLQWYFWENDPFDVRSRQYANLYDRY
ncbi:MAG: hypothetical protein V1723_03445 [Candidatus Uhrbacteria bacterium]